MCVPAYLCFPVQFWDEKPQFLRSQLHGSPRGNWGLDLGGQALNPGLTLPSDELGQIPFHL